MPLINDATAISIGENAASKVYVGDTLVWTADVGPPITPPTVVGWGAASISTATTNFAINAGTDAGAVWDPAENDIIIIVPSATSTVGAVDTDPAGWVNILGPGGELNAGAACGAVAFYHIVTAGEAAASTTSYGATVFQGTETGNTCAIVVRGANTTTPIHKYNTIIDVSTTTVTPHTLVALSGASQPTASGCLVVSCVIKDGTGTYTDPTDWSVIVTHNGGNGKWFGKRTAATTAGVDVASTNITPSTGDEYASITFAITPA